MLASSALLQRLFLDASRFRCCQQSSRPDRDVRAEELDISGNDKACGSRPRHCVLVETDLPHSGERILETSMQRESLPCSSASTCMKRFEKPAFMRGGVMGMIGDRTAGQGPGAKSRRIYPRARTDSPGMRQAWPTSAQARLCLLLATCTSSRRNWERFALTHLELRRRRNTS